MEKEIELTAEEKSLQERHARAKASGAKVAIMVDVNGVSKILYCKEPHRKTTGIYYNAIDVDMVEANYNLVRASTISEVSDIELFQDTSNSTYLAIAKNASSVVELIEVKKSTSLTL